MKVFLQNFACLLPKPKESQSEADSATAPVASFSPVQIQQPSSNDNATTDIDPCVFQVTAYKDYTHNGTAYFDKLEIVNEYTTSPAYTSVWTTDRATPFNYTATRTT